MATIFTSFARHTSNYHFPPIQSHLCVVNCTASLTSYHYISSC